jgi:hypothetical protein
MVGGSLVVFARALTFGKYSFVMKFKNRRIPVGVSQSNSAPLSALGPIGKPLGKTKVVTAH